MLKKGIYIETKPVIDGHESGPHHLSSAPEKRRTLPLRAVVPPGRPHFRAAPGRRKEGWRMTSALARVTAQ